MAYGGGNALVVTNSRLEMCGFGCGIGVGGWVVEPDDADAVMYECVARQDARDGGEEDEELWEDRRDRTSEAGTSGSDSDGDEVDEEAEVRERMGEPSTSGREHGSLFLTGADGGAKVINTVEVKEEIVEAKLESDDVGASVKVGSMGGSLGVWEFGEVGLRGCNVTWV